MDVEDEIMSAAGSNQIYKYANLTLGGFHSDKEDHTRKKRNTIPPRLHALSTELEAATRNSWHGYNVNV